jgi:tetratricopeptide (TPR) repeat protein
LALTHFNRAIEAQTAGDLDHAATLLQHAIELDPTLTYAYNSLGNLYYQQQQYHQAVAMYQQALAVDPEYIQARTNLGSAYIQIAQPEQAIAEFHKVLQADGDTSLAYYNLACVYARTGDSAQAVHYLQRAIAMEPQARVWAHTDTDFNRVRTDPEFQRLVGPS